jgi:hypothetical protein
MTAKEKAEELVNKMFSLSYHLHAFPAKQCAIIAVDEIIEEYQKIFPNVNRRNYWEEVKQEIENI